MQVIMTASYNISEYVRVSRYTCSCEEYNCGCDVEGSCTPDCPNYNPASDDCWVGA